MAMTDIGIALTSPMLYTTVVVKRRTETINSNGRSIQPSPSLITAYGVVSSGPDNKLVREAQEQYNEKAIIFRTKFRLRGPAFGVQPDIVNWKGSDYLVRDLRDDTQWGTGFTLAVCTSMTTNDPAPV